MQNFEGGGTIIVGEQNVRNVRLYVWRSGLKLEIMGMKKRGSSMFAIVKKALDLKGNKIKVLQGLNKAIVEMERTMGFKEEEIERKQAQEDAWVQRWEKKAR
jgi:hypothetical protein